MVIQTATACKSAWNWTWLRMKLFLTRTQTPPCPLILFFIICWIMFKCLHLVLFKHGLMKKYSSRWIFWYEQFYVFSITPKTSTIPLDDVVVSHDLVGRIFIFLWLTLVSWFRWHRGFCIIRESYRRSISPRRSLSSWSWRVRAESGDLWRTSPFCPLWHESAILPTG